MKLRLRDFPEDVTIYQLTANPSISLNGRITWEGNENLERSLPLYPYRGVHIPGQPMIQRTRSRRR